MKCLILIMSLVYFLNFHAMEPQEKTGKFYQKIKEQNKQKQNKNNQNKKFYTVQINGQKIKKPLVNNKKNK